MSIAISEEHRALAQTAAGFLTRHQSRAAARSLLEAETDALPAFWAELGGLGLLGLHVPEEHGGSGFGLAETLVVAEQMGRHLAPGPFVPTVITSAVLTAAGPDDLRKRLLPALADGSLIGAAGLGGEVTYADGAATGNAGIVISGHLADVLLVPAGEDVLVIEKSAGGVQAEVPANLDQSRRAARVRLDAAPAIVLPGARGLLTDVARTVLAAEAAGIAAETTEQAAEYAKVRQQFGRPIATFQAGSTAATSSATPQPSPRSWPCPPRPATPASASRCMAGSGSPGSTMRTCTCAGPRRLPPWWTPSRRRSR